MSRGRESRLHKGCRDMPHQPDQSHQQQEQQQQQLGRWQRLQSSGESMIPVLLNETTVTCPASDCGQQLGPNFTQAAFGFVLEEDLHSLLDSSKAQRKKLLHKFLRMVNTLLNEGGGLVFIHTSPDLLNFFDEQVDDHLMALVPDDSLFDENFERSVKNGHVIFRVKPQRNPLLSTLDFQSKISLNKGLKDPTHGQMRRLLTRPAPDPAQTPQEPLDPDTLVDGQRIPFHENRSMQAKVVLPEDLEKKTTKACKDTASKIMEFLWNFLKLPLYIAAFTKQQNGGSVFLGLQEEKQVLSTKWKLVSSGSDFFKILESNMQVWEDDKNTEEKKIFHLAQEKDVPKLEQKSGYFMCTGISLTSEDKETLHTLLKKKVQDHLLLHPRDSTQMQNQPVELFFHPVKKGEGDGNVAGATGGEPGVLGSDHKVDDSQVPNLYVVEARVSYFHGVCFQNERGPEAYKFDNNHRPSCTKRVPIDTWIQGQAGCA